VSNDKLGLNEIMKRAKEMQEQLAQIQEQVTKLEVTGSAGGAGASALVRVVMDGTHNVKRITIDPIVFKEEKAVIEDLITAAFNDATRKIEDALRQKMGGLAGIQMPDGFGDTTK